MDQLNPDQQLLMDGVFLIAAKCDELAKTDPQAAELLWAKLEKSLEDGRNGIAYTTAYTQEINK